MTFLELYADAALGSNLNSGSTASATAAYSCVNANWDGTSVFTPTDGSTPAASAAVGDVASIFLDAATVAVFIARITAIVAGVNGAITVSTTAKSGTAPASGATGRTIRIGGAWKGPNGAEAFPFGFLTATLVSAAGDSPYVNFKAGTSYAITALMTHANNGTMAFGGYGTTVRDGGRATIDGGTSGTSFIMISLTATNCDVNDFIFQNNGATGSSTGFSITGAENTLRRVIVHDVKGSGIASSGGGSLIECEAYGCNTSPTANNAGISMTTTSGALLLRCIAHDNAGSSTHGIRYSANVALVQCIADSNGGDGFAFVSATGATMNGCDAYNNGGSGLNITNATLTSLYIENCNFVKNGAWGINGSGVGARNGAIVSNGFGAGSMANASGTVATLGAVQEIGSFNYASGVTPWVDPANGDFRINLAAAKGAGRGGFSQTQASYAGAIGFPDVGSCQHFESGAAAAPNQGIRTGGRI